MKIANSPYINEKALYFDEISYTNADLKLDDSHVTKYDFFLNSRWRTSAILENVGNAITRLPIDQFEQNVGDRMPSSP